MECCAGTSALYNMERRPKDDIVFEALGSLDELNSILGVCREQCADKALVLMAEHIGTVSVYMSV